MLLDPLIAIIADRNSAKLRRHLIHPRTMLYSRCCFWAMSEASFLKKVVVSGDIPPVVENIRGVNVPCSISRIRCPYSLFFVVS